MKMKELNEIVDSLIEVTTSNELSDKIKDDLDMIIDDLVYLTMEAKPQTYDQKDLLSVEELEEMAMFEKLVKGMLSNKIALA
jgi:hypothetical protein|tara:strand:+ start:1152 stop:1397 length:246 start_codon:yes stop_codon:yes gene_type:complete